jgi:serine phosphatase RsbU (regulator of sigma subunit)
MPRGEVRAAVASAAALYVVGASLIATTVLLPNVSSPAGAAAVAVTALLTAAGLIVAVVRDRGGLWLAWAADIWGIVLIMLLVASTGAANSPFALIYFFAIGHAAAFQPRDRFVSVSVAGLLAFLAPLVYSSVSASFGAIVCVGAVLALLTIGVIHLALGRVRDQRHRLEFLIAATARLDTSLDPEQTLHRIAGTALPELAELCVIDVLGSAGAVATTVADAVDPTLAGRIEEMHDRSPPEAPARDGPEQPASGRARVFSDAGVNAAGALAAHGDLTPPRDLAGAGQDGAGEALVAPGEEASEDGEHAARRLMRESAYPTLAAVPMVARGRTLGTVSFLREEPFSVGEIELLEELTGRASLAFDNARLYAERAHVAHTLRHSLMPAALPVIPGLQLESFFRPMGAGSEVGGDFYDVFADDSCVWLVVGDVCGKGAEAAVLTGFLRHTTVAYAREGAGPAKVLARVNEAMLDHDFQGRFATAILAHLGFRSGGVAVTLAAAGHPAALVARVGGGAEALGGYGTLLGVFPDPSIPESSTLLAPGDALALYTDGLAEAHAPDRVLTVEQMIERLAAPPPRSARETIDALLTLADLDVGARDDIAILAAHVGGPRAAGVQGPPDVVGL